MGGSRLGPGASLEAVCPPSSVQVKPSRLRDLGPIPLLLWGSVFSSVKWEYNNTGMTAQLNLLNPNDRLLVWTHLCRALDKLQLCEDASPLQGRRWSDLR